MNVKGGTESLGPGETYASSFGSFKYGPCVLSTTIEEAFGPHGGTVTFKDEVEWTRVDVEEFAPVEGADLEQMRDEIYQGYLQGYILPLVRSGVPQAELLDARSTTIWGRNVFLSAILMPAASRAVRPDGKRVDGIRGQTQYTNGRFMFTVSRITVAWPNDPVEKQLQDAYESAGEAYARCEFPQ